MGCGYTTTAVGSWYSPLRRLVLAPRLQLQGQAGMHIYSKHRTPDTVLAAEQDPAYSTVRTHLTIIGQIPLVRAYRRRIRDDRAASERSQGQAIIHHDARAPNHLEALSHPISVLKPRARARRPVFVLVSPSSRAVTLLAGESRRQAPAAPLRLEVRTTQLRSWALRCGDVLRQTFACALGGCVYVLLLVCLVSSVRCLPGLGRRVESKGRMEGVVSESHLHTRFGCGSGNDVGWGVTTPCWVLLTGIVWVLWGGWMGWGERVTRYR